MEKINNINELLAILGDIIPHYQHNLILTWEINERKLEPINQYFQAYENITKNKDELLKQIEKNNRFSTNELKYFVEIVKQQKAIETQLILARKIIEFLVEKKVISGYFEKEKPNHLDKIKTYDKEIQNLQRKPLKENEKKS